MWKAFVAFILAFVGLAHYAQAQEEPLLATMTWSKEKGFRIIEGKLAK